MIDCGKYGKLGEELLGTFFCGLFFCGLDAKAVRQCSISPRSGLLHASTAMGKSKNATKPLTHEEIWDDSALVRSWDEAVEEYKVCLHLFYVHVTTF